MNLHHLLLTLAGLSLLIPPVHAGMEDDPLLSKLMVDQLETRIGDGDNPTVLEADAWIGKDLHKAWFKIDAERVGNTLEELEIQALYSKALTPFWDIQLGLRHDAKPRPSQTWAAFGFKGLAPYWFEVDAAAFINEDRQVNLRLQAEYEWMFTQKLALSPELEMNLYNKNDPAREVGAGLSDLSLSVRLRYEIKREFAPYVGLIWTRSFGETADFAEANGEDTHDTRFVLGVRFWF